VGDSFVSKQWGRSCTRNKELEKNLPEKKGKVEEARKENDQIPSA